MSFARLQMLSIDTSFGSLIIVYLNKHNIIHSTINHEVISLSYPEIEVVYIDVMLDTKEKFLIFF